MEAIKRCSSFFVDEARLAHQAGKVSVLGAVHKLALSSVMGSADCSSFALCANSPT